MSNTIGKISDTASATATASIRSHILNLIAVLGALADTASEAAGATAMKLLRALLDRWTVSTADSSANTDIGDVIGNKLDTVGGTSIVSILKRLLYGAATSVWPATAVGTAMAANATPNTYGTDAVCAAANDITQAYNVVGIVIDTPSAAMQGIYKIGVGAGPDYYIVQPFAIPTGGVFRQDLRGFGGKVAANAQLVCAIKTVTGSETCKVHIATETAAV